MLGRLDPERLLAVSRPVTVAQVREILPPSWRRPLGIDVDAAAAAVIRLGNTHMAGAIRMVSLARGLDPRDFTLFAFGGAGPLHAVALARELGIPEVLIPARPGLTNALGCLVADLRQDFVNTLNVPLDAADMDEVQAILAGQRERGVAINAEEQSEIVSTTVLHGADMQFRGQTHLIRVALPGADVSRETVQALFEAAYDARFQVRPAGDQGRAGEPRDVGDRPAAGVSHRLAARAGGAREPSAGCRYGRAAAVRRRALADGAGVRPREAADRRAPDGPGHRAADGRHHRDRAGRHGHRRCHRQSAHRRGERPMSAIDPITLAVIQAALGQVCNEMDIAFSRAAFSPVIAEADDRSSGIYDRTTGALISQGELGLPVFVGTMQYSTAELIRLIGEGKAGAPEPGDIYIVNDPYLGGTHLMDVRFALPFYYRGEHYCWLQNTGHWPDIGGMVPGGFSSKATEVEQEGLRLPPVKLFKRGVMDAEIFWILNSNMRIADQRIGDIKAQAAALKVGERRLTELMDRYGQEVVTDATAEIRRRAARLMRAHIAAVPDGVYRSEAFVDSDGVVNEPLKIALEVTKAGETLSFDFTGSSPPCKGPMNSVVATTYSAVYLAMRHIFPDTPLNAGAFEPLRIKRPEGTFLDARYPRPVSGCAAEVSQRIAEAVFLALVQAIPDKVTAAPAGSSGNFALGGFDPMKGAGYVMYQISGGGYGGNSDHDGLTNGCSTIGISKSQPVEVLEQYYPILFKRFALREGSGGAGAQRGGFGVHYEVELLRGEARASFVMDHGRFGPPGVQGGADGAPNVVRVHRGGETLIPEHLSKDQDIPLVAGRSRRGDDAGRRRLRRSVRARAGAGRPRCRPRLLHARPGARAVRRCGDRRWRRRRSGDSVPPRAGETHHDNRPCRFCRAPAQLEPSIDAREARACG